MKLEIINHHQEITQKHPLLFIHGMWHAAWCWEPHFMPYFAALGYDTYAISLRNHGKSEKKKATWRLRIKEYVQDVHQAVTSIDGDPILIGHSMGGFIVQKYLEKYTTPAAILLTSVPPNGILGATLKVVSKFPWSFAKANLTVNLYHIIANSENVRKILFSPSLPEELAIHYQKQLDNETYLGYLDMMMLDLPKTKKINPPKMLVIGAQNDKLIFPKDILKTAKTYQADHIIIPNTAHDVMLDTHWQDVAKEMSQWLSQAVQK